MSTIAEVARLVGHSPSTVSRALNNSGYVSEETRRRILAVTKALNYTPNIHAERLRNGTSKTIALIAKEIATPFWAEVAKGVEDVFWQNGYSLILHNTAGDPERERSILRSFRRKSVDGVMVDWLRSGWEGLKALEDQGIAVVIFAHTPAEHRFDVFVVDNVRGGYLATKHLLELGHTRIAFVTAEYTEERGFGYQMAMEEYGLTPEEALVVQVDAGPEHAGTDRVVKHLLDQDEPPTAIFAYNDETAIRIWMELERQGLKVPDDVSLVGFDNIPIASFIRNGLTTVALPHFEYGRTAADFLLKRITEGNGRLGKRMTIQPELIVRGSTRLIE